MTEITSIAQYGAVGIALFLIVSYSFLMKKVLEFILEQEKNFKDTIDNHLKEQSKSNSELATAVKELLDFLKRQNGKK